MATTTGRRRGQRLPSLDGYLTDADCQAAVVVVAALASTAAVLAQQAAEQQRQQEQWAMHQWFLRTR